MALTAGDYAAQLAALLPKGAAWPREPESVLGRLLLAIAEEMARIDAKATSLVQEMRPPEATDLLPDWERVVGLPDQCTPAAVGTAARRAAVVEKLSRHEGSSIEDIKTAMRRFGYKVTVRDLDETAAHAATTLDTTDGRWRFVWWVTIPANVEVDFFDTLSGVEAPLAQWERDLEAECRIRALTPAHTLLLVGYEG